MKHSIKPNDKYLVWFYILALFFSTNLWAQKHAQPLKFETYQDLYYSHSFNSQSQTPDFFFNHKRLQAPSSNLTLLKTSYIDSVYTLELGLMSGDYARFNLAHEPAWASVLSTAFLERKLKSNQRIMAGIFSSYIGIETSVSSDCSLLTRSIASENTPYYFSGFRYLKSLERMNCSFFILNGWQRIAWNAQNRIPAFGSNLQFKLKPEFEIQHSLFIGYAKPDSLRALRIYQHVNCKLIRTWGSGYATFDLGIENGFLWLSPQLIADFTLNPHQHLAARLEWFWDPHKCQIFVDGPKGFNTLGLALCHTYTGIKNMDLRVEVKYYQSEQPPYNRFENRFYLSSGLSYRFCSE